MRKKSRKEKWQRSVNEESVSKLKLHRELSVRRKPCSQWRNNLVLEFRQVVSAPPPAPTKIQLVQIRELPKEVRMQEVLQLSSPANP